MEIPGNSDFDGSLLLLIAGWGSYSSQAEPLIAV